MFIYFKDIEAFLKIATRYNTMRIYWFTCYGSIKAIAQSQKNTYEIEVYGDEKELKKIEELLVSAGFVKCAGVLRWEG